MMSIIDEIQTKFCWVMKTSK